MAEAAEADPAVDPEVDNERLRHGTHREDVATRVVYGEEATVSNTRPMASASPPT
jgi:hypothetical protein